MSFESICLAQHSMLVEEALIGPLPFKSRCPRWVCAVQRRRLGASPTRQRLQPEAIGAVMEVTILPWRLSDAGRRTRGAVAQAAGIRNPSHLRKLDARTVDHVFSARARALAAPFPCGVAGNPRCRSVDARLTILGNRPLLDELQSRVRKPASSGCLACFLPWQV